MQLPYFTSRQQVHVPVTLNTVYIIMGITRGTEGIDSGGSIMYICSNIVFINILQIIQDINALKRLLRQAETDYHALYRYIKYCMHWVDVNGCIVVTISSRFLQHAVATLGVNWCSFHLYRCYVFLCACGNGKLLLQCAAQEAKCLPSPETLSVLKALQIYTDKCGFRNIRT